MLGEDGSCMAIGEECAEKTLRSGEGGEGVSSCGPWRHFECVRRGIALVCYEQRKIISTTEGKTSSIKKYIQ